MPLAFLLAPVILGQSSTTLKYLPPIGQAIKYSYVTKTSSSGMPGGQNMDMTSTALMSVKALSRKADVSTVETTISSMKMTAPPGSPMAAQMKAGNASFKPIKSVAKISTSFKMVGIETSDAATKQMGSMAQSMSGMAFPTRPIKVGDTWTTEVDFSKVAGQGMGAGMMKGKIPVKLKLIALSGNTATISTVMNGTTNMDMPAGASGQTGGKMTMKIVSSGTSTYKTTDGTMINMKMDMTMSMSIMSMNIATKMAMSMKRV